MFQVHMCRMHLKNKTKSVNTYVFGFIHSHTNDLKWACGLKQKWDMVSYRLDQIQVLRLMWYKMKQST